MVDATKERCTQMERTEWVPGHERVREWSGVKDPGKREVLREMLGEGVNIKKSMSQQDDPLVSPSTADRIQSSYESVSGYCRVGRERSSTQPDSYDTNDDSPSGSSQSTTDVPDWMKDYENW